MRFHKRILYPLWGLIAVFIIMFICGLNWWKVIHDTVSLLGTVICIAASVGVVICVALSVVLSKLFESVDEELSRLKKKLEKQITDQKTGTL